MWKIDNGIGNLQCAKEFLKFLNSNYSDKSYFEASRFQRVKQLEKLLKEWVNLQYQEKEEHQIELVEELGLDFLLNCFYYSGITKIPFDPEDFIYGALKVLFIKEGDLLWEDDVMQNESYRIVRKPQRYGRR